MHDKNAKQTLYLTEKTIQQGKLMAAARGTSFSQLVEDLIKQNFNVEEITKAATTATQ